MENLDHIDIQILAQLQRDGRASKAALAESTGLTAPSVYQRVKRLEEDGFIRRYTVLLEPNKVQQGLLAFVRVLTNPGEHGDAALMQFVNTETSILECHEMDGEDSYFIKLRCKDLDALKELVTRIRQLPNVVRTVTSIAMGSVKETGLTHAIATGETTDA